MSYSEYWRVNKSVIDYIELANALRALRKIVAVMDVDAEVVWAGMPCNANKKIELPAVLAKGDYPIPSDKMDVLVGLNVHESFHYLEDSEHAWGYLSHTFLGMKDKALLGKLFEAGEDIHVDGTAIRRGVPGEIMSRSHEPGGRRITRKILPLVWLIQRDCLESGHIWFWMRSSHR